MRLPTSLAAAAVLLPLSALAAEVTTEYTVQNTCERKTQRGDAVCLPSHIPLPSPTHPHLPHSPPSQSPPFQTNPRKQIQVHYRGTLAADGTEFDTSYTRGQPLSFTVGKGQVIKGWDEGLLEMCIGDKRVLTIPPAFGYGDRAMGPIPAGSTLVFETELVGIEGVGRDEL